LESSDMTTARASAVSSMKIGSVKGREAVGEGIENMSLKTVLLISKTDNQLTQIQPRNVCGNKFCMASESNSPIRRELVSVDTKIYVIIRHEYGLWTILFEQRMP
jgi:hypothetical protein